MKNKFILIALFLLVILGGFLRFYRITTNPPGLTVDEVGIGYNAYSILKTGRDEYGRFLPITFRSYNDYKLPTFIYLVVPSVYAFGLNEFAVRFPVAILGTLSIIVIYLIFLELSGKKEIALVGAFLATISPWSIYFSRVGSETMVGTFFVAAGLLCFLKFVRNKNILLGIFSSLFFAISVYSYHSQVLFTPLFLMALYLIYRKDFVSKKYILVPLTVFAALVLPLAIGVVFGSDSARAQMQAITNDIDFTRNVLAGQGLSHPLLIFYAIRKFLAYLEPSFLFYNGLNMTTTGSFGLGVMYLFEAPLFILGIFELIKSQVKIRLTIISWIFLGILPAAVTLGEQHPIRTLCIFPALIFISSLGTIELLKRLRAFSSRTLKIFLYTIFGLLITWNLFQAFLVYIAYFPNQRGDYFMEGTKEAVLYLLENKDKYKEIVFDPVRGQEGPYQVSVPHAYILFYSKYDPAKYQKIEKRQLGDIYGFDKFTIRGIDWRVDRSKKGTLFIGSQWSLPLKDLKQGELLKTIYLTNGNPALYIVTPKN